jgi:hypothetical protein
MRLPVAWSVKRKIAIFDFWLLLGIFVAKQQVFRFSAVVGGGFRLKHQQQLKMFLGCRKAFILQKFA